MGWGDEFFEIPVYRLSQEDYDKDSDEYMNKFVAHNIRKPEWKGSFETNLHKKQHQIDHFKEKYGVWSHNEIVGYIRLYFGGSQILGTYVATSARRIVRTRRKIFEQQTHKLAPEIDVPHDASDEKIYQLLLQYLEACKRELKGRYIDTETFEVIGPHVRWRELYSRLAA